MSTYAADRRGLRPRGLSPEVQAKIAKAQVRVAQRQKIERVRTALAIIVDIGERDWTERKRSSCAGDAEPSRMLLTALAAAEDFDALIQELGDK